MKKVIIILLINLLLTPIIMLGQEDFMPPMNPERREQMEALRIWKMTEFLDLTSDQSVSFFPKLKEMEAGIRKNLNKQRDIMIEINKLTEDPNYKADPADVKKYAHQLAELEKEIVTAKEHFVVDCSDVLTPEQQLKFITFDNRFRNRLMRSLSRPDEHKPPMKEWNHP
jgi:Spy/CpxP family protein refolding chaperone